METKWLTDHAGNKFVPYTNSKSVFIGEDNSKKLTDELNQINDKINAKDNTQADWDESDSTKKSYIKNKPTSLPANGGGADTLDGKHANDFTDNNYFEDHLSNNTAHQELFNAKLDIESANNLIKNLSDNPNTGVITVTRMDNSTFTIDIPKSLVFKSATFNKETHEIIITWSDDSQSRIPVEELVDIYTGSTGDVVKISVSEDNIISATIKEGSINQSLLSLDMQESMQSAIEHLSNVQTHIPDGGSVGQVVGLTDDGIEWIDLNLGTDYPKKLSELENDCNFISNFVLDNMLSQKVDKINGMGLSSNDFSLEYKEKLCGIDNEANKYVHPETHPASMITEDETHQFVTSEEKALIGTSNLPNISFDKATSTLIIGEQEIDLSSLKGSDILNNGGELTPGFGNNMLWKTFNTDGISINRVDYLNGFLVAIGGTYLFYGTEFPLQKINLKDFTDNKDFSLINIHYYFNNYYILGLDETSENNISYIFKTENLQDFEVKVITDVHKFLGLFYNGNNYIALSDNYREVYVRNVGKWDDDFLTGKTMAYCGSSSNVDKHRDWIITPVCMDFPRNQKIHFESSDMWQNLATTGSSDSFSLFIDKSRYGWKYISDTRYYILVNGTGEIVWNNDNFSTSNTYYKNLHFNAGIKCNGKLFLVSDIYGLFINDFSDLDSILENNCEGSFLITSSSIKFITHNYKYVAASTDSGELLYAKIS